MTQVNNCAELLWWGQNNRKSTLNLVRKPCQHCVKHLKALLHGLHHYVLGGEDRNTAVKPLKLELIQPVDVNKEKIISLNTSKIEDVRKQNSNNACQKHFMNSI